MNFLIGDLSSILQRGVKTKKIFKQIRNPLKSFVGLDFLSNLTIDLYNNYIIVVKLF